MRQAQLAEIQACEETLDSVMREMEEERQAALIASSILDEALGDIRLQYEAHAEDLAKRVENARGVLVAAAAQERRASEADASLRARTAALEAERKALDERARSAQEFEATIRRCIEVLDRNQREQDARSRDQAQRAQELEGRAQALEERAHLLEQQESTLAAHERTARRRRPPFVFARRPQPSVTGPPSLRKLWRPVARRSYGSGKRCAGNGTPRLPSAKPR